ncbi:MAG: META domain-containing protein [Alistipes sp.]|nr:META domain-containing protein [Alistipes sp.]
MMKRIATYAVITVAAFAVGCCPCRFSTKHAKPLVGTVWHLVQLSGTDLDYDASVFNVTFGDDGKLSGIGACNRFSAPYTTTERFGIDIGGIASTRMYCPELDREQRLFRELDDATHYEIDGPMLLILNNGEIRAVFSAAETRTDAEK